MNVLFDKTRTEKNHIQNKQGSKNDQVQRLRDTINFYNIIFYQKNLRNCSCQSMQVTDKQCLVNT